MKTKDEILSTINDVLKYRSGFEIAEIFSLVVGSDIRFNPELEVFDEVEGSDSEDYEPVSDPNMLELIRKGM